jgi:2-amino-4-hydroxy-6-hydroxymethyldihydropteridine diphosphokinase
LENQVFILLGTNLGDRVSNLEKAKNEIDLKIGKVIKTSNLYETAPWGITDQPSFLNQVLQVSTYLKCEKILSLILKIELDMGRKREVKWGSRLIDIDILYFGNKVIKKQELIVPHPFLQERRFTLVPLAEIAPDFIHPILQETNSELLEKCEDDSNVILMDN